MFNIQSIALTAALFGLHSAVHTADAATGCYPTFSSDSIYTKSNKFASSPVQEVTPIVKTSTTCTVASTKCVNGKVTTGGNTVTKTYNFECVNSLRCSQTGYEPVNGHGTAAWKKLSECSGTAPAAAVKQPKAWSGSGCPKAYSGGTDYAAGDVVSVKTKNAWDIVYTCREEPSNQWCGMAGYEPLIGQHSAQAWTEAGSCSGTMSPTESPVFVSLVDEGGCPASFDHSADYEEGDKISKDGLVYKCKGWPESQHCSQAGYTPGEDVGGVEHWKAAWDVVGHCTGTIQPTSSPSYTSLEDMGGCPNAWETKGATDPYEEGDMVSTNNLVFVCKAWPYSGHCGQAGYEPDVNPATPDAWQDAWMLKGFCSGSIGPTSSPNYDPTKSVGACPDEWSSGIHTKYEEGDQVSVTVSNNPLRMIAFKCKAWPYSGFCAQLSPTVFGGDQGWAVAGSCDGSIGPTQSPSFDSLSKITGCPREYSSSNKDYEAGDMVSVTVSDSPLRQIVYECNQWPASGYCIHGEGMAPGTHYGPLGWTLKGSCNGSNSPTGAPARYTGNDNSAGGCQYQTCKDVETSCTCSDNNCPNSSGQTNCKKTTNVCVMNDVNIYSKTASYSEGNEVRVGLQKYKCKGWPSSGWCGNEAYQPVVGDHWSEAWYKSGVCRTQVPTGAPMTGVLTGVPTDNPTNAPSKVPTESPTTSNPTNIPTNSPTPCGACDVTSACIQDGGSGDISTSIPCGSCQGYKSCSWTTGNGPFSEPGKSIGKRSCQGSHACSGASAQAMVGNDSCVRGWDACLNIGAATIGDGSCHGSYACLTLGDGVTVGEGSCHGTYSACAWLGAGVTSIGDGSCLGHKACYGRTTIVGDNDCKGDCSCCVGNANECTCSCCVPGAAVTDPTDCSPC